MTKNERRLFCVRNHDDHKCLINNNKCKKACRRMDLDMNSVKEEEIWQKLEAGWICTDVDNDQYCREINENTFEFAQWKINEWIVETILLECYTDKDKMKYMTSYGYSELQENRIIAECIFETDFMGL